MSERGTAYSQIIAVLFALMMVVSIGGTAFVGAAAAQQTGGTFDEVMPADRAVGDELNISGDRTPDLVGDNGINTPEGVTVLDDGRINITNQDTSAGTFTGVSLPPEQVAATTSADVQNVTNGDLADFLQDVPDRFNITTNKSVSNNATAATFIELAPQSEFSQINNTDIPHNRTNGTHDFIVVAPLNVSDDNIAPNRQGHQLSGLVEENISALINDRHFPQKDVVDKGDIAAFSVDNDKARDGNADTSLLASKSTFGAVYETLVGPNEHNLTNQNIDAIEFTAGTFDAAPVTIDEVRINESLNTPGVAPQNQGMFENETIHSQKITLQNGDNPNNKTFFSTINQSINASANGDTILLDAGNYTEYNQTGNVTEVDTTVTITNNQDVTTADSITRVNTTTRSYGFNDTVDKEPDGDHPDEAIIRTQVNISAPATVENIGISNGTLPSLGGGVSTSAAINVSAGQNGPNPVLDNVIINHTTATGSAINVTRKNGSGLTLRDSTVLANNPVEFEGTNGLNLSGQENGTIADNYFVGFQTQVNDTANETRTTQIFRANEEEFTTQVPEQIPDQPGHSQYFGDDSDGPAPNANRYVAQSAVPYDNDGAAVANGTEIFGALNASDRAAGDGDIINVSAGLYDNGTAEVHFGTDDIEVVGAEEAVVEQAVALNSSDAVTFDTLKVNDTVVRGHPNYPIKTAINASARFLNEPVVDIRNVNVSADDGNISVGAGAPGRQVGAAIIHNVTLVNSSQHGINITGPVTDSGDGTGIIAVNQSTINNVTGGEAIRIEDASVQSVNVSVNDINGNSSNIPDYNGFEGLNLSQAGNGGLDNGDQLRVRNNSITNVDNGTAIRVNETIQSGNTIGVDFVRISDNTLKGGAEFTGIEYDLDDSIGTNISGNIIEGKNVKGGVNSIGVDFVNLTVEGGSGGSAFQPSGGDPEALSFNDNVVTGHARVINVRSTQWKINDTDETGDYQFLLRDTAPNAQNNSLGTYINGTTEGEAAYSGTFGDQRALVPNYDQDNNFYQGNQVPGTTLHYLPGSLNQSFELLEASDRNTSELVVTDPTDDGMAANAPGVANNVTKYRDDIVTTPDLEQVDTFGESRSAVEVESRIVINSTTKTNNFTFTDFQLDSDAQGPTVSAIDVRNGHNSQSTFGNMEITSRSDGINISANETDVNVIKVINSDITVEDAGQAVAGGQGGPQGIIFGFESAEPGGDIDDRDGFVIHDSTIAGPGIDVAASTGLNMTDINASGKEALPVQLNISQNFITGFERQVETPDPAQNNAGNDVNITALNFTSEQFGGNYNIKNQDDDLNISDNEFGQQVLVFNTTNVNFTSGQPNADPDDPTHVDNLTVNSTDVFGSIDAAVATLEQARGNPTLQNQTVRVYATTASNSSTDRISPDYDADGDGDVPARIDGKDVTEYDENVDIAAPNVTIRGPSFQTAGTESLSSPDALINGTVEFHGAGDNRTKFTGFTVIAPDNATARGAPAPGGITDVINITGDAEAGTNDPSGNITIENTSISAFGNNTTDLPYSQVTAINITKSSSVGVDGTANPFNATNITGVYAGDHDFAETTNSSLNVSNATTLTITDSVFNSSTEVDDGRGIYIQNNSGTTTIDNTRIANHKDSGLNATGANATVLATGASTIEDNDESGVTVAEDDNLRPLPSPADHRDGFLLRINDSTTIADNAVNGVTLDDGRVDLFLNETTIQNNTDGVHLVNASTGVNIAQTTITGNNIGLNVTQIHNGTSYSGALLNTTNITNNALNNAQSNVRNADENLGSSTSPQLNVSLNFFGTTTNVDSTITGSATTIYDPFLTENQTDGVFVPGTDQGGIIQGNPDTTSAVQSTEFGHDVTVPADSAITVGFPGAPAENASTVGTAFDTQELSGPSLELYKFERTGPTSNQFTSISSSSSEPIEFRDAFVIVNNGDTARSVGTITYQDPRDSIGTVPTFTFQSGVNFVAPVGAGNVSEVLVGGGDNDLVQSGTFTNASNLFGASNVSNSSFGRTYPDLRSNFRNGVGQVDVHPHRGYFVIAQNGSAADGQITAEQVAVGGAPTAGNIANKLNQTYGNINAP